MSTALHRAVLATLGSERRRRRLGVLGGVIVLVAFGLLVASMVAGLVGIHRARTELSATEQRISHDQVLVARAQVRLARAQGAERAESTQVAAANRQLERTGKELSGTERAVFEGRLDLNALQQCLGGVEEALNALSVGDNGSAVKSLGAVAAQCKEAEPTSG